MACGSVGAPVTLDQYFALPDTPQRNSPVGKVMQSVLLGQRFPITAYQDFEIVRNRVRDLLEGRGGPGRVKDAVRAYKRLYPI